MKHSKFGHDRNMSKKCSDHECAKLLRGDRATRMGQEDAMILPVNSRPRRRVSSTTSPMEDDSEAVSESMAWRLEASPMSPYTQNLEKSPDKPSAKIKQ